MLCAKFSSYEYIDNSLECEKFGYVKFCSFTDRHRLSELATQLSNYKAKYAAFDPLFGQTNAVTEQASALCTKSVKRRKKHNGTNNKTLIRSFKGQIVDEVFVRFLSHVYKTKRRQIKDMIKRIEMKKTPSAVIIDLLSHAVDFCKRYNISIQNEDISKRMYDAVDVAKVVAECFRRKTNVNLQNIQLHVDSVYSITRYRHTATIAGLILSMERKIDHVIDGNANVGSTAIEFSRHFKTVDAVEINRDVYIKLKNNVNEFRLTNVDIYEDDIVSFVERKQPSEYVHTCLFLDPPWGGMYYKTNQVVDLVLGTTNVLDFVKNCRIRYVCIKVPFNFNMASVYNLFEDVTIHKLPGFFVILIRQL
jgi:tRNA/tmRNA/rRNA uracil-C5-methylase (TrmA/RlmC/RlmD family)